MFGRQQPKPGDEAPTPAYLHPYREAMERHGPSFEATLWASKDMQRERFRIFCDTAEFTGMAVIDAGCGLGDFAAYLHETGIAFREYLGLEGLAEIVESARRRGIARARFEVSDFVADEGAFERAGASLGGSDFIVFSGSLNTLDEKAARRVLNLAWSACRVGVVFNFLSDRHHGLVHGSTSPAKRFDTLAMLAWALSKTPRVLFRQDYFNGHDATIAILRVAGASDPKK